MAKRVFVQGICDVCGAEYQDATEGVSYVIDDGGNSGVYEIDLCPAHTEIFHNDILNHARVVKRAKADKPRKSVTTQDEPYLPVVATSTYSGRPRTIPCDVCDYMAPDKRSIGVHRSKIHGIKASTK